MNDFRRALSTLALLIAGLSSTPELIDRLASSYRRNVITRAGDHGPGPSSTARARTRTLTRSPRAPWIRRDVADRSGVHARDEDQRGESRRAERPVPRDSTVCL